MGSILEKIEQALKDMLIGWIESNLTNMFTDVNEKVGTIAAEVGQTPSGWNGGVYQMIRGLSENVIVPIAGIIITFVLCYELISMITEKNNLHDMDTWMFFKWFFKAAVAIYLVTHTFDIVMAVFDIGQNVVSGAAGVIHGNTSIDIDSTIAQMRMEHDTYGDEAACIIVDERGKLVLDDVYNGFDDDTLRLLDLEVKEVPEMPDPALTVQDMKDYGYAWAGVLPAGQEAAEKALEMGCEVYRLYSDNTEGLCVDAKEIADHAAKGGMLGISKESWMAALENENYLKAAEMSMEDDYGMIDGIINNGPKEDKTAEVKAPERGEKSSIMDRLKSAKAEKQKECCPPQKHKGEIEL